MILLDLNMPFCEGLEACKKICSNKLSNEDMSSEDKQIIQEKKIKL